MAQEIPSDAALVLSGGMALGAYQAGAYDAFGRASRLRARWLLGSSVGAVNAALIAGNPPDRCIAALRSFWFDHAAAWRMPAGPPAGYARHAANWMSVLQSRLFGAGGHFRPRIPSVSGDFKSLYDLTPMRRRLEQLIDFRRLNAGDVRITVGTTDVETGEFITFDTARGERIGVDQIMASCGFLPEFAPVQIGGRFLADGGLVANAPLRPVLRERWRGAIFVIDLFAPDGGRPRSLEEASSRKNDLIFSGQTRLQLEGYLDQLQAAPDSASGPILHLSYRPRWEEAGPERPFDYSRPTITQRWEDGDADMREAVRLLLQGAAGPVTAVRRMTQQG